MISLFAKRGWFWELIFWLLIVELARVIGGYSTEEKGNVEEDTARPEHRT